MTVAAPEAGVSSVVVCTPDPAAVDWALTAGTQAHAVLASTVGCDLVPRRAERLALEAERALEGSATGWTVLRTTVFHDQVWQGIGRRARWPVVVVPRDTRWQVLDPDAAAARLVEAVESGPRGRLPDLGGAFAYEAGDLARSVLAARGLERRVVALNAAGIAGAAIRAGANTTPNRDAAGETWNDFVRRMMDERH